MQDEEYTYWEAQKKQGQRTMLGVPLLRGDSLIGIFRDGSSKAFSLPGN